MGPKQSSHPATFEFTPSVARRRFSRTFFPLLVLITWRLTPGLPLSWAQEQAAQRTPIMAPICQEVFVLSGGGRPSSNHERYYEAIRMAHETFRGCQISNFVTTGRPEDKVALTYESLRLEKAPKKFLKIKKMQLDPRGFPITVPMIPTGGFQGAASFEDLKKAAQSLGQKSTSNSETPPLLFYVTDHGSYDQSSKKAGIVLWNGNILEPGQLHQILHSFPADQKVVMLFDECYGGDMLRSLWNEKGELRAGSCGISAASPGQLSFSTGGLMKTLYNSLVEGQNTKQIKGQKQITYRDLYDLLLANEDIRSTPMLSSDLYAMEWWQRTYPGEEMPSSSNKLSKNLSALAGKFCKIFPSSNRSQKLPGDELVNAPSQILFKAKEYKKALEKEIKNLPPHDLSSKDLAKKVQAEREASEQKWLEFHNFLLRRYNPHMRKMAEKQMSPEDWQNYQALKDKESGDVQLEEEERQQLSRLQEQVDQLKLAIKDEAKIARRHSKILPPGTLRFPTEEKTIKLAEKHDELQSEKNEVLNNRFRFELKWTKMKALQGLELMIENEDWAGLNHYMNLVECEKMPLAQMK